MPPRGRAGPRVQERQLSLGVKGEEGLGGCSRYRSAWQGTPTLTAEEVALWELAEEKPLRNGHRPGDAAGRGLRAARKGWGLGVKPGGGTGHPSTLPMQGTVPGVLRPGGGTGHASTVPMQGSPRRP